MSCGHVGWFVHGGTASGPEFDQGGRGKKGGQGCDAADVKEREREGYSVNENMTSSQS